MLKLNHLIITVLFFLFIVSCKSEKDYKGTTIDLEKIAYGGSNMGHVKNVSFIYPEIKDSLVIGVITKVLHVNHLFYLFDKDIKKRILVYNDQGRLIYSINKFGHGPGEYIEPLDFDVDAQGNVFIWDNGDMKIIKYSSAGKDFEEIKPGFRFFGFGLIDDSKLILNKTFNDGIFSEDIVIYNYKTRKTEQKFFPYRKQYDNPSLVQYIWNRLYRSDDHFLYYRRFTPDIYRTDPYKGVVLAYHIKDFAVPGDSFMKAAENPSKFIYDRDYIKEIQQIYENSNSAIMTIKKDLDPQTLVISRKDNQQYYLNQQKNETGLGFISVMGTANGKFFTLLEPDRITESIQDLQKNKLYTNGDKQKLSLVRSGSNAVIMLFDISK